MKHFDNLQEILSIKPCDFTEDLFRQIHLGFLVKMEYF